MKEASLIVTRKGGRTSHAAIIAREFGIPAIVGCGEEISALRTGMQITGSCAEGDVGVVYSGFHSIERDEFVVDASVRNRTKLKLNVGFPGKALGDSLLPVDGVGLARLEFILTSEVGVHPLALVHYEALRDWVASGDLPNELLPYRENIVRRSRDEFAEIFRIIEKKIALHGSAEAAFRAPVEQGVGLICAAFHPRPVLVRLSDLKSNEYRDLAGGKLFEPQEENPMIGWRGASRYIDPRFEKAFSWECLALRNVSEWGLDNLQLMVPFCRSPEEGAAVRRSLESHGIGGKQGPPLFMMVELPSNVLEAQRFIEEMKLSGGSIGTNDLVQTTYALSRDDLEGYRYPLDARSPAVKSLIRQAIAGFSRQGLEIGICGQAPSDYPEEVPAFLVQAGISSISVTPDTAIRVRLAIQEAEKVLVETSRPPEEVASSPSLLS